MKPNVLFFARNYQADFFPLLTSDRYESVYVTLTLKEKETITKKGLTVAGCFEEEFDDLPEAPFDGDYLETSFSADRYLRFSRIKDRRKILGKEITFWTRLFDKYNPRVVVNETVALEIAEVLYIESKKRNARYSSWMSFPTGTFYWQSEAIHNSLDQAVFDVEPDAESLRKTDEYIARVRAGSGKPFYIKNVRGRYNLNNLLRNIYSWLLCKLKEHKYSDAAKNQVIFGDNAAFFGERIVSFWNSLFRGYDDINQYNDYEKVFFPLHYEPEAALFYMAEFNDNQLALIENYAKCLKLNQVLVVKEHPQQTGVLLLKKFRELKKRIPNLVYLPGELNSAQLIEKSRAILTLGSTAGLEALIMETPVIIMGKVFYDKYPDINVMSTFEEVRKALRTDNLKKPRLATIRKFLAQVVAYSYNGNPYPYAGLYDDTNVKNIIKAIEDELAKQLQETGA